MIIFDGFVDAIEWLQGKPPLIRGEFRDSANLWVSGDDGYVRIGVVTTAPALEAKQGYR